MKKPQPSRETIAQRAYLLWEQAGKPAERDKEFWLRAESELTTPTPSAVPSVIAAPVVAPLATTTVTPPHEVPSPIKDAVKIPGTRPPRSRTSKRI